MTSSRNPSYTNLTPCNHLADYKLKHGLVGYKSIQNLIQTSPNGRTSLHKLDSNISRCTSCYGYSKRHYFCLICSSISCSDHTSSLHTQSDTGHDISVDILRAELYCFPCSDQVYDPDFDKIVMSSHIMGAPKIQERSESIGQRLSKRRRLASSSSSPPTGLRTELVDLKKLKPLTCIRDKKAKSCYPLGLRGLNNLGNTCFMNSVLQALLNAPPLRDYFLTDQHSRKICRKRSGDQLCLQCDIARIFAAVFSGDRNPYSPAQFLYSWWQHSANFASYEQQDAHEFFISALEWIHEKEGKSKNQSKDNIDCKCIAHKAFSGQLRSDVTCLTCGFTSTTFDPCVDISLNLDSNNHSLRDISTLSSCLNLFTRPEQLGSDQKLFCQNCQERRDSLKQMSIGKLPLVLCLHIKRFEHSSIKNMSRKIDCHLHFPFSLEMRPYLSSSIVSKRFGNRIFALEGDDSDGSSKFEIFAVIAHSGGLEAGHYVTYLRLKNQWYKCDDAWITEVDVWVVRNCQCYMMFYLQKSSASSPKQNGDLI